MARTIELPLTGVAALLGTRQGIWAADRGSRSLVCHIDSTGTECARIALEEAPLALAATSDFIAAALDSGALAAFDLSTGAPLWTKSIGSSAAGVVLRGSPECVWAAESEGPALISFDRIGSSYRVPALGFQAFVPSGDEVFWLSREGMLVAHPLSSGGPVRTAPLPPAGLFGGFAACANALWLSVPEGLQLIDRRSLAAKTTLIAPEGPVRHLICEDGKLIGGEKGVFILNPMADACVHAVPIAPESPLKAIAATASKIWALESARPVVHIADLI